MDNNVQNTFDQEIWIYGHWLSCNLGDRYQARGIIKYLCRFFEVTRFTFVNFFDDTTKMSIRLDNQTYPVYGPNEVKDNKPRLIILPSGSVTYQVNWISLLVHQLESNPSLKEIIIWGGFGHGKREEDPIFRQGLSLLAHPKVTFWSRSWRDAQLYHDWFEKESRLAGDPMAYWILEEQIITEKEENYSVLVIPSIYAWRYNPPTWERLIMQADRVVAIDTVADRQLKQLFPHLELINSVEELIPLLKQVKLVISGRLHGGLLSALLNIPTIMVITDDAPPGQGTFKFEAVARTGCGQDEPLCHALSSKDISTFPDLLLPSPSPSPSLPNVPFSREKYLSLTQESLSLLVVKIKEL